MPTGYAGEGKKYNKKAGRWEKTKKEQGFDYDSLDLESAALLVSFFRWYPDYFLDLIRSEDARYKLELPTRIMLRIFARYRNVYITGSRGMVKTTTIMEAKTIDGVLYPGEKIRYCAPSQKQSATLASNAFKDLERDYPLLASWWAKNNDRQDMFRITTGFGSEFSMYAPRGDNSSAIVGEEMGQEGEGGFDMQTFETEVSPTCRLTRKIHGEDDRTHINLKESYIANACSRENKAFTTYRAGALKDMIYGDDHDGYAADIPWVVALLCNLRDIAYYKKEKAKLTAENWLREMEVYYIGTSENPLLSDEVLARSQTLRIMEDRHCGDEEAIYIVSHDVSYETGNNNAKCADSVIKLTKYTTASKRDKYRKQIVYVDAYPPPATEALQAEKVKNLWMKYCLDGAETTYLVIDARAVGKTVVQELMKPTRDGTPPLCCINHSDYADIEQPDALPVIYPLKANARGTTDNEGEMIKYAQREWEQGNIEILTPNVLEGVETYKRAKGIKDDLHDLTIANPYKQTEALIEEIGNLGTKVTGLSIQEVRRSKFIQRDRWSATKYGLHLANILEDMMVRETYKAQSSWTSAIQGLTPLPTAKTNNANNERQRLIALRKR